MCGIFGIISDGKVYDRDKVNFIKDYMVTGQLRGTDGSGLIVVDKNLEDYEWYKKGLRGSDFLQLEHTQKLVNKASSASVMIGHNRKSTKGSSNDANSHPFAIKDDKRTVVGVHNGTAQNIKKPASHPVDSFNIYNSIVVAGIMPTLEELRGSYALVWWDSKDKVVYIAKNHDRPLHAIRDSGDLYIGSEEGMLYAMADRNGINGDLIERIENHVLYTIDPKDPCEFKKTKYEVKKPVYTAPATYSSVNQRDYGTPSEQGTMFDICMTKEQVEDELSVLRRTGLELKKELHLYPLAFQVSAGKQLGKLIGEWVSANGKQTMEVHMNGVTQAEYDRLIVKELVTARLLKAETRWSIEENKDIDILTVAKPNMDLIKKQDLMALQNLMGEDRPYLVGPNGNFLTMEDFEKRTKRGCDWCQADLNPEDHEYIDWIQYDDGSWNPVCYDCSVACAATGDFND